MSRRHLVLRDDDEGAVPSAIVAFRQFAREQELPQKIVSDFCIILDELISNIMNYGYRGRTDSVVELTLGCSDGVLEVEIADDAPPFNMLARDDPRTDQPISERSIGGLGIYLVKKLSDELKYVHDGRNRLTIRKRVS